MINVGIIGLGLIGQQRAEDISRLDNVELYGGFDTDKELSKTISSKFGFESFNSSDELIASSQINLIVIAVPHVHSALYVISSLKAGKHVLCEKPMGITVSEAERILQVSKDTGKLVEPGFNYRYYPAIRKAKVLIDSNKIGKLISSRIVIGHGGRPGMENEWKLEREKSGGGSLIDPGIHVIDLSNYLFGYPVNGFCRNLSSFWQSDVEDNSIILLQTENISNVTIHSSTTEWKSNFKIEIFGSEGSLIIDGRSKSYGPQSISFCKKWFWLDEKDKSKTWKYDLDDDSFRMELKSFIGLVSSGENDGIIAGPEDGLKSIKIIEGLYNNPEMLISFG